MTDIQNNEIAKETLPSILLVVDIDNNIAFNEHRKHMLHTDRKNTSEEWNAFNAAAINDTPNKPLIDAILSLSSIKEIKTVFITGRNSKVESKDATYQWLKKQGFEEPKVLFRYHKDFSPNDLIKAKNISAFLNKHNVAENTNMIVIDDNSKVLDTIQKNLSHVVKMHCIVPDFENNSQDAINTLSNIVVSQLNNLDKPQEISENRIKPKI